MVSLDRAMSQEEVEAHIERGDLESEAEWQAWVDCMEGQTDEPVARTPGCVGRRWPGGWRVAVRPRCPRPVLVQLSMPQQLALPLALEVQPAPRRTLWEHLKQFVYDELWCPQGGAWKTP